MFDFDVGAEEMARDAVGQTHQGTHGSSRAKVYNVLRR